MHWYNGRLKDIFHLLLKRLKLRHFRTYEDLDLRLAPGVTLLHGPNAAGKTNVLEAVYVLGTTKSFRTRTDRELINWTAQEEGVPRYSRLEGDAEAKGGLTRVEMAIAEQAARGPAEASVRKQFKLNGRPARAGDVVGEIKVVFFSPDDVALVTGSPSNRRRYMDLMLCQIDHRYLRLLQEYGRVVVQRNSLLQRLRGRPDPASLLEFWDDRLVTTGVEIMSVRKAMLRVLNDFAREAYTDLSGLGEDLTISYKPSLEGAAETPDIRLAELFRERLAQSQTKEIYQGMTLTGPHRDDLQFTINGVDAQYFGSRGQQRSVALSLRLAEMRYMTNRTGEQPILLLDEAMAELDEERRALLLRLMESHPQVLATTANLDAFPQDFRDRASLMRVDSGTIEVQPPVRARAS
jgi:DNA replication and repair protein RecF